MAAPRSALGGGRAVLLLLPNRLSRKLPGPRAALAYCGPQLFCASAVSTERRWFSRSAPPMPPLRRRSRLVVIWSRLPRICWIWLLTGPHCADWPLNSEKKPELSQPMRLACSVTRSSSACCLAGRFLIAADLLVLGRVAAAGAAVDGRQLSFKPDADRIALRARAGGGRPAHLRHGVGVRLRQGVARRGGDAEQRRRRSKSSGRGEQSAFQAYPAIESDPRGSTAEWRGQGGMLRPRPHPIAASRGSVTSFPGRRCGKPAPDIPACRLFSAGR